MKKVLISFIFLFIFFLGINSVFAEINTPEITDVEYPDATSLKIHYKTNNENTKYKVFINNMTNNYIAKTSIDTDSYTLTGLTTGRIYNIKMRIYYIEDNKAHTSDWSNVVGIAPKVGDVTINSITAGDEKITLNYSVKGQADGVEIYVNGLSETIKTNDLKTYTLTDIPNGKTYTITLRAYLVDGKKGLWSESKDVTLKSDTPVKETESLTEKINALKTYSSIHVLKTYSTSNLKKVAKVNYSYFTSPQSLCDHGSYYIVQHAKINSHIGKVRLAAYSKTTGKRVKSGKVFSGGHGNGLACDKNLQRIYAARSAGYKTIGVFDKSTLNKTTTRTLPVGAGGIAYDSSNKKFYVKKGQTLYVLNSNFQIEKSIHAKRKKTSQDIGAYHGLILHIIMKKHGLNYIDMYRVSDKAYVGSFKILVNEVESVVIDDGYLVILNNKTQTKKSEDNIYKSTTRISIP